MSRVTSHSRSSVSAGVNPENNRKHIVITNTHLHNRTSKAWSVGLGTENRFQYHPYLPGQKCNADFGASFRCVSQLKTVARHIPRRTCKTARAPNVNFVLCRSPSLVFS